MRFRATTKWAHVADLGGLLFFAQRAEELLFDYTLDSYKPPALNSRYVCEEAVSLSLDVEEGLIDENNLIEVMAELSWSISQDPVAKSLLDIPSDKYILDIGSEPLRKVRAKLEVLGRTLDPNRYLDQCANLLSGAVKSSRKSDIDRLASLFYTTLINMGVHKSHLYEKTLGFFYRGEGPKLIDRLDCIDEYIKFIYPVEHSFKVTLLASSLLADVKDSAESAFNVKFCEDIPEEIKEFAEDADFQKDENEVVALVEGIRVGDCYMARETAESRLGKLRDLFTLYHHKQQISWREQAIIQQCCEDGARVIGLPKNPIEKGLDQRPGDASLKLNRMLRTFKMTGRDFNKFNRAVDFHGLSVNTTDGENQVLNLWVALETIVPTQAGSAKIRQIIRGVLPFIAINYLWRVIGRLTQDLINWNKSEVMRILKKMPVPKETSVRKKVLLLLVDDSVESIRRELYSSLRDFHLLRYRVFCLSCRLETPAKTLNIIASHEKKVSWQLRRIYRTRNLIIHSGRTPNYVNTLIENGHDYLDQVLLTIIRMVGSSYRVRTIDQAFELASIAQRKIERSLRSRERHDAESVGLLINEHDFI